MIRENFRKKVVIIAGMKIIYLEIVLKIKAIINTIKTIISEETKIIKIIKMKIRIKIFKVTVGVTNRKIKMIHGVI